MPTFQMAVLWAFKTNRTVEVYAKKTTDSGTIDGRNRRCYDRYPRSARPSRCLGRSRACMNMQGVRKPGTATVTTAARGLLATE